MIFNRLISLTLLTSLLTSCASWLPDAHRVDITQGNAIKRDALEKIHSGMKMSEITPIIGNPMIKDPFHAQRWDYIYRYEPGRGDVIQSRLTLYFEGDVLIRMDDSEYREPVSLEHETEAEPAPASAVPAPQLD